jgi:outer membrane immunogenic protein
MGLRRQLLISTAVGLVMIPRAMLAADIPLKAPVIATPAQYSWAGPYVGVHAGYGWSADPAVGCDIVPGSATPCTDNGVFLGAPNVNARGFLGGAQLGYNWQTSNWLFGVETDFSGMNLHDAAHFATTDTNYANAQVESRYDWLGTTRGRLGLVMDRTLIYGTGGLAYARVSHNYFDSVHGSTSANNVVGGWTIGGGVEYALNRNWSVKGEYLYVNLRNTSLNTIFTNGAGSSSTATFNFKNDINIVRAGVNFRF